MRDRITGNWHLWLTLLFAIYVTNKMLKSKSIFLPIESVTTRPWPWLVLWHWQLPPLPSPLPSSAIFSTSANCNTSFRVSHAQKFGVIFGSLLSLGAHIPNILDPIDSNCKITWNLTISHHLQYNQCKSSASLTRIIYCISLLHGLLLTPSSSSVSSPHSIQDVSFKL